MFELTKNFDIGNSPFPLGEGLRVGVTPTVSRGAMLALNRLPQGGGKVM